MRFRKRKGDLPSKALQELLEHGCDLEDKRWQAINDILNEGCLRRAKLRFVERYDRNVLSFHLHGSIVRNAGMPRLREFCAVIEKWRDNGAPIPFGMEEGVFPIDSGNDGIQATMFVDVRQFAEQSKQIGSFMPSVIRLQTLDECKRHIGNPNSVGEEVISPKRPASNGPNSSQRELAIVDVPSRERRVISLDKIEEQVVKGGPELIDNLASIQRDLRRRLLRDLQCFFAIRLADNFIRLTACIFGNASLNGLTMFHCPEDFPGSGFNGGAHEGRKLKY